MLDNCRKIVLTLIQYSKNYMGNDEKPRFPSSMVPLTGFYQACCFTSNTLSTFFCFDPADYPKNNGFSK